MHRGKQESGDFLAALRAGRDRLIPREARVLLAVSGGPDSVALAAGWMELEGSGRVAIAHFDHGLREDSAADAAFVAELAAELGVPVSVGHPPTPIAATARGSLEEAARAARYHFLAHAALEQGATHVATGHTLDDQVETVLFSLLRGTGPRGLAGMPAQRPLTENVLLARPLLELPRESVRVFLESRGRTARADASNDDPRFARNRIRNELLPWLRARFNPRVDEALLRLAGHAGAMAAILDKLADQLLEHALVGRTPGCAELDTQVLRQADRYVVTHAFKLLLERQDWPRAGIGQAELEHLADLVPPVGPRAWDLPRGLKAQRIGDIIRVTHSERGAKAGEGYTVALEGRKHGPWTILASEPIYADPWVNVGRDTVIRPDGRPGTHVTVTIKPGVCVLALDDEANVFLTDEFHYGVGENTLEAVSGGIEPGEDPLETARRELREELGIEADEWLELGLAHPFTAVGVSPTRLYLARGLRHGSPTPEGTERIRPVRMPLEQAAWAVVSGRVTHAPSGVLILKAHWLARRGNVSGPDPIPRDEGGAS